MALIHQVVGEIIANSVCAYCELKKIGLIAYRHIIEVVLTSLKQNDSWHCE